MENTIVVIIEEERNGVNDRYTFRVQGNVRDKNGRKVINYTTEAYLATGTLYKHMDNLALELGQKYPTTAVFFTTA